MSRERSLTRAMACRRAWGNNEATGTSDRRKAIDVRRRFAILRRDDFTCAYCGARPGNDCLEVDHMLSVDSGGSDHDNNLITACQKCNNGKRESLAIPKALCTGTVDEQGWIVWKTWGPWALKWNPTAIAKGNDALGLSIYPYENRCEYWIGIVAIHQSNWEEHLAGKKWATPEVMAHFDNAINFARTLMR